MAALEPQYMTILKKVLAERFVPSLPPLLDTTKPPAEQQAKQLSRAFSAFALHKMLDITPQAAAASVVDDFNDKGIDAIHYDASSETLAYFRNQGNVAAFLADLMETHYTLTADQAIAPLRNIQNAADAYPRKRLLDYLSSRAPQL